MFKITPTALLSSAANMVFIYLIGAFMIITMAVVGEYVITAYQNYNKMQDADVLFEARIHRFGSMEFETNPHGEIRYCTAITTGKNRPVVRERNHEGKSVPVGQFCANQMTHERLNNWKKNAITANHSKFETMLWAVGFFFVFMAATYLVVSIPANLLGLVFTPLLPFTKIIALVMTLPVVVFWAFMTEAAFTPVPSAWHDANGYVVETQKVFVTRDHRMYKAPEQLFDWTESGTMSEVKEKF